MTTPRHPLGLAMRLQETLGLRKSQALRLLPLIIHHPARLLAAIERSERQGEATTTALCLQPG